MKASKALLLLALCTGLFLYSCKKGDTGPAGPPGPTGGTGSTGSQGPAGTANVIASKWFRVDSSKWNKTDSSSYNNWGYPDTTIYYEAVVPTPLITPGVKDSGVVLFFIKDSTGNGYPNITIVSCNLNNIDYRTSATNRLTQHDLFYYWSVTDSIGSSFTIRTRWYGWGAYFDPTSVFYNPSSAVTHSELTPKTNLYFRYVIIPAGKTQRSIPPVNYKDYNAVVQYYHLADK